MRRMRSGQRSRVLIMQHQYLARVAHARRGRADHARESALTLPLDLHDLCDRQAWREYAIQTARHQRSAWLYTLPDAFINHELLGKRIGEIILHFGKRGLSGLAGVQMQ